MSSYSFSTYTKQSGTIQSVDGSDTITVLLGGTIISEGGQPTLDLKIVAGAGANAVTVYGAVYNGEGEGIHATGSGNKITVNSGGGITAATHAIYLVDAGTITNSGTIYSGSGIRGDAESNTLTNNSNGTILAGAGAYAVNFLSGTITNSGIISGGGGISFTGNKSSTVTNKGTIAASSQEDAFAITFGGGDDFLDSRGGWVFGWVAGGDGNDELLLGAGNDTIDGGAGADTIEGGEGFDYVSYASYVSSDTSGIVASLVKSKSNTGDAEGDVYANIEGLIGSKHDDKLTGNNGNNVLDGGGGVDTLIGGAGDDIYYIYSSEAQVIESGRGMDMVYTTDTYDLKKQKIEILSVADTATTNALNLTGSSIANKLIGNDGVNFLDGKAGADTMIGGGGDDTYYIDNVGDVVVEAFNDGTDWVSAFTSYVLPENVEKLVLLGKKAINGTGNELDNVIGGNVAANKLVGGGGADDIDGDLGKDTLTGGEDADRFWFDTKLGKSNVDTIMDFSGIGGQDDKIVLDRSTVFVNLAQVDTLKDGELVFGVNAEDSDDRIVYDSATGKLYYDPDGKDGQDKILFAVLNNKPATIDLSDFIVV